MDVDPITPFLKVNIKKIVNLFTVIFIIVMIEACAEQREIEVQSPSTSSQPISFQEPINQPSSMPDPLEIVVAEPKPFSPKDWEQVSRIQRILGTITDIQISDGIVQSIDLKVKQNVRPVNSPVDYDYIDQTLHLIVEEKLTAAGSIQDKMKKGSSFLVSFAQFAIPPKDEIALASRFSYNCFFFEHNGSFIDTKGHPFDLKAEFETVADPKTGPTQKTDRKTLFALDENQLSKPLTQIPYYQQGKSEPLPEIVFKQFDEGHQPWLSNPVTVALVNCSNLISLDKLDVLQNKATSNEKKIVIDSDRIITEVNSEDINIKVQMTKPGGVSYEITMYAPQGTEVLFVKQIIEITPS
jgi:hypothetical protein